MSKTFVQTATGEQEFSCERDALMFVAGYTNPRDYKTEITVFAEPGGEIHIFLSMVYPDA